jgi:hypothetical protein
MTSLPTNHYFRQNDRGDFNPFAREREEKEALTVL